MDICATFLKHPSHLIAYSTQPKAIKSKIINLKKKSFEETIRVPLGQKEAERRVLADYIATVVNTSHMLPGKKRSGMVSPTYRR